MQIRKHVWLLAVLFAVLPVAGIFQEVHPPHAATSGAAQADKRKPGLYMTFQTDKGNIACKLYETEAPVTVHTMVGLAIGKLSYVDPQTKQATRKKFFAASVDCALCSNGFASGLNKFMPGSSAERREEFIRTVTS